MTRVVMAKMLRRVVSRCELVRAKLRARKLLAGDMLHELNVLLLCARILYSVAVLHVSANLGVSTARRSEATWDYKLLACFLAHLRAWLFGCLLLICKFICIHFPDSSTDL